MLTANDFFNTYEKEIGFGFLIRLPFDLSDNSIIKLLLLFKKMNH